MANYRKRTKLIEQLPPTPCTKEMRAEVDALAEKMGLSIAEIQRRALSLFLSAIDSKVDIKVPTAS
jgi:hypothetical protein